MLDEKNALYSTNFFSSIISIFGFLYNLTDLIFGVPIFYHNKNLDGELS